MDAQLTNKEGTISSNGHRKIELLTDKIFNESKEKNYRLTNKLFSILLIVQWVGGILTALIISPRTWEGDISQTNIHVWLALFLGGIISAYPLYLLKTHPFSALTRHVVALAQVMYSAILIHLTGGRIETHFHVFGSLAFIAFYKDWPILLSATIFVALDHMIRGFLYPQSVYGIDIVEPLRWLEHAGWVIFEDIFLLMSIKLGLQEMAKSAREHATVVILKDSIEQKVIERTKELHNSQEELKKSNKELEEFAFIASHDLQEPLRKVLAFSDLIKTKYADRLDESGIDYINRMTSSVNRMRNLIQDLLEYSKVGTNKEKNKEVIDLNTIIENVLYDLETRINQTNSKITVSELPCLFADKLYMNQLFQNLISNSIKYAKFDISPIINIYYKKLDNGDIEIFVEDNGIGFDEIYANKIFMPFQRLHGKKDYEGTGIGLAICAKILAFYNGSITVKSIPGIGSKFSMIFPASIVFYSKEDKNGREKESSYNTVS